MRWMLMSELKNFDVQKMPVVMVIMKIKKLFLE